MHISITNRRLREIVQGLSVLKERRLPSVQAELRVAAQLRSLIDAYETYADVRKKIVREHEIPSADVDSEVKLQKQIELRDKLDKLESAYVDVPAPKRRLTKDDLPQTLSNGDDGRNTVGNAGVMVALAPEFFDLPDEVG